MRLAKWTAVAAIPLWLSGCGVLGVGNEVEFGAPAGAGAHPPENVRTAPSEAINTAETNKFSGQVKVPGFGESFRYGSGLRVQVDPPERFTPSPWIERRPGAPMRLRVSVRNGTEEVWNPSQLHLRLASGFVATEQIFDYEQDVIARPEDRVPAGGSVSFYVGYWVPDAERLSLEVDPGRGYQTTVVATRGQ
jgi:hypothetical protein